MTNIYILPNEIIYNIFKYFDNIDDILNVYKCLPILTKLLTKKYQIFIKKIKNINNNYLNDILLLFTKKNRS